MALDDYLPRYFDADKVPVLTGAGGSKSGGLITTTGIMPADADTTIAGVADRTLPQGSSVGVFREGIHLGVASGAITNGDPLCSAAPAVINGVNTPRLRRWVAGTDPVAARVGRAWSTAADAATVTYALTGV